MSYKTIQDTSLTAVADAIREKGGTQAALTFPGDFVDAINDIKAGDPNDIVKALMSSLGSVDYVDNDTTEMIWSPFGHPTNSGGINTTLKTVKMQALTTMPSYAFAYCNALTEVALGDMLQIASNAFRGCTSLTLVDIQAQTAASGNIVAQAFYNCISLSALVLRYSAVATLMATSALQNTAIASGTGYIYVPRALLSSYQTATNWSTYAAQFRALEDYTDDGTINGDFIMPT